MSSTNRGAQRSEADDYATPIWVVDRLFDAQPDLLDLGPWWLEPCAGEGRIISAVNKQRTLSWTAVELRDTSAELTRLAKKEGVKFDAKQAGVDFFAWNQAQIFKAKKQGVKRPRYSVLITNPPYRLAEQFLKVGLEIADTVVLLLRLNFLGSERRQAFFEENMPWVGVLPNRPTFTLDGKTDSVEYAWMIWDSRNPVHQNVIQVLRTTPKTERRGVVQSRKRGAK